jgi:hypothetical protein
LIREWNDEPNENEEVGFDENSVTKRDIFFVFWSLPESINSVCFKYLNGVVAPFPAPILGLNNKTKEISQIRYDLCDMVGYDFINERYD